MIRKALFSIGVLAALGACAGPKPKAQTSNSESFQASEPSPKLSDCFYLPEVLDRFDVIVHTPPTDSVDREGASYFAYRKTTLPMPAYVKAITSESVWEIILKEQDTAQFPTPDGNLFVYQWELPEDYPLREIE